LRACVPLADVQTTRARVHYGWPTWCSITLDMKCVVAIIQSLADRGTRGSISNRPAPPTRVETPSHVEQPCTSRKVAKPAMGRWATRRPIWRFVGAAKRARFGGAGLVCLRMGWIVLAMPNLPTFRRICGLSLDREVVGRAKTVSNMTIHRRTSALVVAGERAFGAVSRGMAGAFCARNRGRLSRRGRAVGRAWPPVRRRLRTGGE
jgi:hypothetical protein